jgi:hypothetical protein
MMTEVGGTTAASNTAPTPTPSPTSGSGGGSSLLQDAGCDTLWCKIRWYVAVVAGTIVFFCLLYQVVRCWKARKKRQKIGVIDLTPGFYYDDDDDDDTDRFQLPDDYHDTDDSQRLQQGIEIH